MLDRIEEFCRSYHAALDDKFEELGRDRFADHGQPTRVVAIIKASDGYATFYLEVPPEEEVVEGFHQFDLSEYTLNRVCQSISVHRLKVADPNLGERWDAVDPQPADTEPIPEFQPPWINLDVREAILEGRLKSVPGMTISPVVNIRKGVRREIQPARMKIWAPVSEFPRVGRRRWYLWPHADFWWKPEELNLAPERAPGVAAQDLLSLRVLYEWFPLLTPERAQEDAAPHAAQLLEEASVELRELLDRDPGEEEVHQWLAESGHELFLDPDADRVWSKLAFGDRESDFVVRRSDGTYVLIEIEAPTLRIFKLSDQEPTAELNHACQQVADWRAYIAENLRTVRAELGLDGIYRPEGRVIMGRSGRITGDAVRRWRDMKANRDVTPYTYDELIDRVRTLARQLRTVMHVGR